MFCASLSVTKQMSSTVGKNLLMAGQTFPGKTHMKGLLLINYFQGNYNYSTLIHNENAMKS